MFITAQSATAMTWEQPKYLSAHKQIKKMCYIYKHIHTHTCVSLNNIFADYYVRFVPLSLTELV